jgi:signal transduction histidine kinase
VNQAAEAGPATGLPGSAGPRSSALDLEDLLGEIRRRAAGAQALQDRMSGLLDAVVAMSADLDVATVLARVVESACKVGRCRCGTLGVLDELSGQIVEFVTHGAIEEIPPDPGGAALVDIMQGRTPVQTPTGALLSIPVQVRGQRFGTLYVAGRSEADPFDADDEAVLIALAAASGVAIENAQLFRRARRHQEWTEAIGELTQTLLEGRHERAALARMVKRSRDLGNAELAVIAVDDGTGRLVIQAVERANRGDSKGQPVGVPAPVGEVLTSSRWRLLVAGRVPLLLVSQPGDVGEGELSAELRARFALPAHGATALVPITVGEVEVGVIALAWTLENQLQATETMDMLTTFGKQMGLAIEAARAQRQRSRTTVLEDRDRIARDMHDHVIQRLYAAGLSLQAAGRVTDGWLATKLDAAVADLDAAVKDIRHAIFELNHPIPEGGLGPELEALVEKVGEGFGFLPNLAFEGVLSEIPFELEADVIAVVREALSNSVRHAQATDAEVRVSTVEDLVITVRDNGIGLSGLSPRRGLANLAERARARGGSCQVQAMNPGTQVVWTVPLPQGPLSWVSGSFDGDSRYDGDPPVPLGQAPQGGQADPRQHRPARIGE